MSTEGYIALGVLVVLSTILAIGKTQYEKHPEWFGDE